MTSASSFRHEVRDCHTAMPRLAMPNKIILNEAREMRDLSLAPPKSMSTAPRPVEYSDVGEGYWPNTELLEVLWLFYHTRNKQEDRVKFHL